MTRSFPDLQNISLDSWQHESFRVHEIQVDVLRLDKIHPDISGNKWFKLKYYLKEAKSAGIKTLLSFGGAYSNHILAVAAAAFLEGFSSIGLIRGEKPAFLSHTLTAAKNYGMELRFLSRSDYDREKKSVEINNTSSNEIFIIPEGGAGPQGVQGSTEILSAIPTADYSHICCAVGTGTTLAGIINSTDEHVKIIGVSVLKGTIGLQPLHTKFIMNEHKLRNVSIMHDDHFGGYAKKNTSLLDFMNDVFKQSGIPTDFVYTGKLFFSIWRLSNAGYFPTGSRVLILHTGGLQGNLSLPKGRLQF